MSKWKRFTAALVLAATLAALALPVSAATSSFTDVRDSATALNADVLRLMGVVSGSGGNTFNPGGQLTRAEFCVMAVQVLGRGSEVPRHTTRTIFTDVTSSHWARGYINLASSITIGGGDNEAGSRLISGVGTGQFKPDNLITYAQAVTILIRMLGYSDTDVGAVWPAGYLNLAASLGLSDGVSGLGASSPITRAQTAQLFVNLLRSETKSGSKFYETLGKVQEDVTLVAVNVTDGGTTGAIRTSAGTFRPAAGSVNPTGLQGLRGALVLNEKNQIAAFVPDGSTSVTITLAGDAQAAYLQGTDGTRYTVAGSTPAYTNSEDEPQSTYSKLWVDLRAGSQVTLFLTDGTVTGVYYASGGLTATEAYVVTGHLTSGAFSQLTGGASGYTIKKDNQAIRFNDIQPYDVITYDPFSNTLVVSDLRLTCVYETATPNLATPEKITVLGHDFPVLDCALESISQFKAGDSVVLLLTADGQVAGLAAPTSEVRTTATGWAGSDGVVLDLPNGTTVKLSGSVPDYAQDRVVTISASKGNTLNVSRISSTSIPGDFSLTNMTLGKYTVAAGARIYESIGSSAMAPLTLSDLEVETIPQNQLYAYHLNSSGMVDVLILNAVTGDAYTYGILRRGSVSSGMGDLTAVNTTVSVTNGSGGLGALITGQDFKDNGFGGVADSARTVGGSKVAANVFMLDEVTGVKRSDFFQDGGKWYVNAKGTVYLVSSKVEGYIRNTGSWISSLDDIRAYSNDMTLYIDPVGHRVRIIAV